MINEKRLIHIRQLKAEFTNPAMMHSVGKDSSVVLHLTMKSFAPSKLPLLPLKINENTEEKLVIVASKSSLGVETQELIYSLQTKEIEQVSMGSSLKLYLVTEGEVDIYPRFAPTMGCDTDADAVVLESGKRITQYENNETVVYNKENLLNPWFVVR